MIIDCEEISQGWFLVWSETTVYVEYLHDQLPCYIDANVLLCYRRHFDWACCCPYALHNTATLFNISSSGTPVGTIYTATYICRDGYWIMWPCYGVHFTVWHSLFVCFVSQCIHWFILTSARFLLEILLWRLILVDYMQLVSDCLFITCIYFNRMS